ncbi:ABC transporter ATP-binding protein [Massilia forsythiae]|uniref:ABC transporter ATP-binding protein n=1 Tax=Massilia forsythiae TaxID=2728020 RepID=A0A7Z2ZU48_9BURK|nr:ABC transporter ATP-binding protein [Massilia forsythiae]QJE01930.1 ABC transporter ATP-binding protein [Massilia forsythiae]
MNAPRHDGGEGSGAWRERGLGGRPGANDAPPLLQVRGLEVYYPDGAAVHGFDLDVHADEVVALVGESGCGKSTVAAAIAGLLPARARAQGTIRFEGRELLGAPDAVLRDLRGSRIGMVFQEPMTSLNPVLTIGVQIGEVLRRHWKLSAAAARARAIELLDLVGLPEPQRRIDDHPHHLSGGQRQRVMIAIAVACEPRLLVADEPTTALDATIQAQVLELLDGLRRRLGMGLLLITHDLAVVGKWADRVAVMRGGAKVEEGTRERLFFAPQHPYSRGLLAASLHVGAGCHHGTVRLTEIGGADEGIETTPRQPHAAPPAIRGAAGADAGAVAANASQASAAGPVLAVHNLVAQYSSRYGTISAVKDVSFEIARGETLGLVGESGCGKSTLSKTIVGLNPAVGGQVILDGTDIAPLRGRALRPHRSKVQVVFQDPYAALDPRQRIGDALDEVLAVQRVRDRGERRRRVAAMLDAVGLPASAARRYPHEFSGGQRQRIGIARALILRPKLLICDEPVSALDVSVRAQILNLFVDLKREFGLSYLFISHDLAVIDYMADRVMVMQKGEAVETIARERLFTDAAHPYTRSLIAAAPRWPESSTPAQAPAPMPAPLARFA